MDKNAELIEKVADLSNYEILYPEDQILVSDLCILANKMRIALEKIANTPDEVIEWKDAGVRCRDVAQKALK